MRSSSIYRSKSQGKQPCQNVLAAGNFATISQFLATYSTLDFTRSPLAGKGTWCLLSTATKHFDRAGQMFFAQVLYNHSRPQRPQSFWSAPKFETSGADFLSMRIVLVLYFQPNRFARLGKVTNNHRLLVLEPARSLDPW